MEVVASLSQGRTAAAQCGLFTYKSVLVIFEPHYVCKYGKITKIWKQKILICFSLALYTQIFRNKCSRLRQDTVGRT